MQRPRTGYISLSCPLRRQAVNARSVERNGYGIPQPLLSRLHILARHGHRLVPHRRLDAVQRHSAVSQLRA